MKLPPFAPYPPVSIQEDIVPQEWALCIDSWIALAHGYLLLPKDSFTSKLKEDSSVIEFLSSYVHECARSRKDDAAHPSVKAKRLRREAYLLVHRIFSEIGSVPSDLLRWDFLADLSIIYAKNPNLKDLLASVWTRQDLDAGLQSHKVSLIRSFETLSNDNQAHDLDEILTRTAGLLRASSNYGLYLMAGSDFIDGLATSYKAAVPAIQEKLVIITYRCFMSLMELPNPRFAMLLDHLYSLKSSVVSSPLLAELCSTTQFVQKMRNQISGPEAGRGEKLIEELSKFEPSGGVLSHTMKPARRKVDKGKGKEKGDYGNGAMSNGVHVHKMSLVTQIQDLFPDLGSAFVVKLLDEFGEDTEQVTAHLLDNSLPPYLKALDRSENLPETDQIQASHDFAPGLSPDATPPLLPTRRNIYDDDAFDRLAISPSQVHRGAKNSDQTADMLLQDRASAPNKAAILSALAAFDPDDDERDDTYDVEDVGGTVDAAVPGTDEADSDLKDENDEALFRAYKTNPEAFGRDAQTRRGKARLALKSETRMTDEAIEGWAIMVARDPRRLRRLEAKFEVGQRELERTSYREGLAESGTEESDRGEGGRGRGRGGFRGRGRGRGVGSVTGPADDRGTQVARQRKDANKGARANHNRRDQRAKKMSRAGFPG